MLNYRKLFLAIFFLGIIVRLFTAVMLPDFMMTDTVYHLSISKNIVETGTLPLQSEELGITNLPPALFHVFIASNSILTGIAINPASTTIFAVLISLLQLLVTVILLRELFPKSWEYGAAFFTMLPLLTKFAGINYPETLASLFVVSYSA